MGLCKIVHEMTKTPSDHVAHALQTGRFMTLPRLLPRWWLLGILCFSSLAALSPGLAEGFSVTGIEFRNGSGTLLATVDLQHFFNKARCDCKVQANVRVLVTDWLNAKGYIQVVAGPSGGFCVDANGAIKPASDGCIVLRSSQLISSLPGTFDIVPAPAANFMGGSCSSQDNRTYSLYVYTDETGSGKWTSASSTDYTVDNQPSDKPIAKSVTPGDGLVKVTFDPPASAASSSTTTASDAGTSSGVDRNIRGYQVLCEKVDETPAFASAPYAPQYDTAANLCSGTSPIPDARPADARPPDTRSPDTRPPDTRPPDTRPPDTRPADSTVDGQPRDSGVADKQISLPADVGLLDKTRSTDAGASGGATSLGSAYVCSDRTQSAGSVTISGLTNGTTYRFYAVTIDSAWNPSTPTLIGEGKPELAEDLWQRYKRSGGQSDGGYCFIATAAFGSYDHPQVRILRDFRDQVLLPSRLGQAVVEEYYRLSPGPATWLAQHSNARPVVRALLWPVTLAAGAHLYTTATQKLLLLLGVFLVSLSVVLRRKRRPSPVTCVEGGRA
jgi:hypothetical protein